MRIYSQKLLVWKQLTLPSTSPSQPYFIKQGHSLYITNVVIAKKLSLD